MDIEHQPAPKSHYFTPAEAKSYYGVPRTLQTIVIHHWNSPQARGSFAGNLNYLQTNAKGTSANAVIGYDERVHRVRIIDTVKYPNVAFTSGGRINAQSVAIECDPWGEPGQPHREEILKAIGYRVWQWRSQFGFRVPLSRHRDYAQTSCPGAYDSAEIDRYADKWANGGYNPPAPTPTPPVAAINYHKLDGGPKVFVTNKAPTNLWVFDKATHAEMSVQQPFERGQQVTIFGYAQHPTGSIYYMTKYSFGEANTTGKPAHPWGFNKVDLTEWVAPAPQPTPAPTPPTPTPEPEPVLPTPEPQPQPTPIPQPEPPAPEPQPAPSDAPPPLPDYSKENNTLLRVIKASIDWLVKAFKKIFNIKG